MLDSDRLERGFPDNPDRSRRREEFDEALGGGGMSGRSSHPSRENGDPLNLRGQRPDEVDTVHWKQLADPPKTDLGVASGHDSADSLATLDSAALWQHPVGYP